MPASTGEDRPAAAIMQLISGKCLSRCVSLAAELGIADLHPGSWNPEGSFEWVNCQRGNRLEHRAL